MNCPQLNEQEKKVLARLQAMGGRANEASFGAGEFGGLCHLIAQGIVRRVRRFEVEIAPEAVQKMDAPRTDSQTCPTGSADEPETKAVTVVAGIIDHASVPPTPESDNTTIKVRKAFYRKLGHARPDRVRGLAARIVERLESLGPQMRVRALERSLHRERFPEWPDAVAFLTARKIVTIDGGVITLVDTLAAPKLPDTYPEQKPKRKRRRRPRTAWFNEKLQRSEDMGVPIGDVIELDRFGLPSNQVSPVSR